MNSLSSSLSSYSPFLLECSYIRKRFPPGSLLVAANNRMGPNDDNLRVKALLSAIAMFQDPPAWATAADAPSDWALLQAAKALRLQKAQDEVDTREPASKPAEAQNKPDLTEYPLALAAAGLAPSSHHRTSSLQFVLLALLAVGLLLLTTATTPSFSNVATVGVGPIKLLQRFFRPVKKEPSEPQVFLPRVKRQTKKILGLGSIFAAVDNDMFSAPVAYDICSAPVITRNPPNTDMKPTIAVPSIVKASSSMEDSDITSSFLDSYYALGFLFVDKSRQVWSLLRRQLVKVRVVWEDNSHALGSFFAAVLSLVEVPTFKETLDFTSNLTDADSYYALGLLLRRQLAKVKVAWDDDSYARLGSFVSDKPQHVRSLLHRQLVKLRGIARGVLEPVVPLP